MRNKSVYFIFSFAPYISIAIHIVVIDKILNLVLCRIQTSRIFIVFVFRNFIATNKILLHSSEGVMELL